MTTHGRAPRSALRAAADRTGHAILHTLYQQSLKHDQPTFFIEFFALDPIMDETAPAAACRARHGRGHATCSAPSRDPCATGGYGRAYFRHVRAPLHRRRRGGMGAARRPRPVVGTWNSCSSTRPAIYGAGCLIAPRGVARRRRHPARTRASASWSATRPTHPATSSRSMTTEIRDCGVGAGDRSIHLEPTTRHPRALPGIAETARDLRRRRRHPPADPGDPDRPLQHGRHPDELTTAKSSS